MGAGQRSVHCCFTPTKRLTLEAHTAPSSVTITAALSMTDERERSPTFEGASGRANHNNICDRRPYTASYRGGLDAEGGVGGATGGARGDRGLGGEKREDQVMSESSLAKQKKIKKQFKA